MKLKLSAKAGDAGQRGNGRKFPALMIQIVAGKDVREKMFLQKGVDDRRKKLVAAGRGDGVPAAEPRSYLSAVFVTVPVRGHGAGLTTFLVGNTFGLAFVHDGHERIDAVETAGEARISVELNQNFLDFVDRQSRVQTFVQRAFQFFQIAVGRERRDGDDALLFRIQCAIHSHAL